MQASKKTGGELTAILAMLILAMTTTICFIPIFLIGLLKLIPIKPWQDWCTKRVDKIAVYWCDINNFYVNRLKNVQWQISGTEQFNPSDRYIVIANHQSWLDIVILLRLFNRKIPMLKFFIKDQLKWIPFLGFAWWAMGCPFMKRYSKEYLAKYPDKQGKDLQATLKAIEGFKRTPASIMNFIEGTRFSQQKHSTQESPHQHLLKPKAGGMSFILSSMGQQLASILDVTIVYPSTSHSLWDFLCRRVDLIKVHIRQLPIPKEFKTPLLHNNSQLQADFKVWLNAQWAIKDQVIASLK